MNQDWVKAMENVRIFGENAINFSNRISEAMKPINDNISKMAIKLNSIDMKDISETFRRIGQGLAETVEDINNYKEAMLILGYPPTATLDIRVMRQIGKEYVENGEENLTKIIDDTMTEYFNEEKIIELKEEWAEFTFLEDRKILLDSALDAHNSEIYVLSVPSLLSQMEGIVIQGYNIKQKVVGWQFKQLVTDLFNDEEDKSLDFNKEVRGFYLDFILVGFEHGQEITSPLSRHAILHGAAKPHSFSKEEVSLKIILMMDNIIRQVNELSDNQIDLTKEKLRLL